MRLPFTTPSPRTGMPDPKLARPAFEARLREAFRGEEYDRIRPAVDAVVEAAWAQYDAGRKAPVTRKAGEGYHDPDYDLAVEWVAAKAAIDDAQRRHADPAGPPRILIVNGSPRSEHTCPGEMSKSWRLVQAARDAIGDAARVEVLDLARTASEFGRTIHPCKACFSTAAPLCHWPCSCYPNHGLGQHHDWMNDIYPLWVEAHGVIIVTPVHWYAPTAPLKLVMDRLVCADGGNPDPTRTQGKDAKKAKAIELEGWDYPQHLKGRFFALAVHGDVEGAHGVKRSLHDWLEFTGLRPVGRQAELDRYIGYWEPYATSHDALDADAAVVEEVRNAARALLSAVTQWRAGGLKDPEANITPARKK